MEINIKEKTLQELFEFLGDLETDGLWAVGFNEFNDLTKIHVGYVITSGIFLGLLCSGELNKYYDDECFSIPFENEVYLFTDKKEAEQKFKELNIKATDNGEQQ